MGGRADDARTVGRYTLYGQFASGGMASVHLGRLSGALGFTRTVAMKRLHPQFASDPQFAAMFLDEARLASRIHHPNVVATLDVVEHEDEIFLVMEYVRGESLSRLLRDAGTAHPLPPAYAIAIAVDALHGLHAAHEARNSAGQPLGIVHRDVSPQNVLVGVDGVARIIDFGVAKARERVHQTRGVELRGKVAYMAPEVLTRERIDRRADVYAAAVVLWEALTGRRFIDAENEVAAIHAALHRIPEAPSSIALGLPPAIDEIVLRGLAKDPNARFATALEMAGALEGVMTMPSKREIGRWVARAGEEALKRRSAALGQIEADVGAPNSTTGTVAPTPSSPEAAHVLATPRGVAPVAGRRWSLFAVAAVAALIVADAAFLGATRTSAAASQQRDVAPVPISHVAPVIAPVAAPAAALAPPAAAAPATVPRADDTRAPAAAPRPSRAARSGPKPASCRQPFTIDHGIKVPKLECL